MLKLARKYTLLYQHSNTGPHEPLVSLKLVYWYFLSHKIKWFLMNIIRILFFVSLYHCAADSLHWPKTVEVIPIISWKLSFELFGFTILENKRFFKDFSRAEDLSRCQENLDLFPKNHKKLKIVNSIMKMKKFQATLMSKFTICWVFKQVFCIINCKFKVFLEKKPL